MKETILLYHFTDEDRLLKVKRALLPMGIRLKAVKKEEYLQPVGFLAGVKGIEPSEKIYDGEDFEQEMLVMAGFTSQRVDAVIQALRKSGAGRVNYKAVLTSINQFWDSVKLYGELSHEHAVMSGKKQTEGEE